jgi:hypothetical protein
MLCIVFCVLNAFLCLFKEFCFSSVCEDKHRLQQRKKTQQFPKPTLMHLMMAETGRNMKCSDEIISLTLKFLKLDVCCTKEGGEN